MTVLTDAYILRVSARGDYDRQYAVFTKDLGKIQTMAKGASKITSKLASHLDFFCLTEIMIARGINIYRLAGAQIRCANKKIRDDVFKCLAGKVFVETLELLLPESQPEPEVFLIAKSFFESLADSDSDRQSHLVFNTHTYKLLAALGYQPEISAKSQAQLSKDLSKTIEQASDRRLEGFAQLAKMF